MFESKMIAPAQRTENLPFLFLLFYSGVGGLDGVRGDLPHSVDSTRCLFPPETPL
jgi:hypothetical protein